MNIEVIRELSDFDLVSYINKARDYEKNVEGKYEDMIDLMIKFHECESVKNYVGTYMPQFKRQIHREIERRFKLTINYDKYLTYTE